MSTMSRVIDKAGEVLDLLMPSELEENPVMLTTPSGMEFSDSRQDLATAVRPFTPYLEDLEPDETKTGENLHVGERDALGDVEISSSDEDSDSGDEGIGPPVEPYKVTYTDAFILQLRASLVKKVTPFNRYSDVAGDTTSINRAMEKIFNRYGDTTIAEGKETIDLINKLKIQVLLLKIFELWFYEGKNVEQAIKHVRFQDHDDNKVGEKESAEDSTYDYSKWYVTATLPSEYVAAGDTIGVGITKEYIYYLTDLNRIFDRVKKKSDPRKPDSIIEFFDFLDDEDTLLTRGYKPFSLPALITGKEVVQTKRTLMGHLAYEMPAFYSILMPRLVACQTLFAWDVPTDAPRVDYNGGLRMIQGLMKDVSSTNAFLGEGAAFENIIGLQKTRWVCSRLDTAVMRRLASMDGIMLQNAIVNTAGLPSVLRTIISGDGSNGSMPALLHTTTYVPNSGWFGGGTAGAYMAAVVYAYYASQAPTFARMMRIMDLQVHETLTSLAAFEQTPSGPFYSNYTTKLRSSQFASSGTARTRFLKNNSRHNNYTPSTHTNKQAMISCLFEYLCRPDLTLDTDNLVKRYYPIVAGHGSRELDGINILAQLDIELITDATVSMFLLGKMTKAQLNTGLEPKYHNSIMLLCSLRSIAISSGFIMHILTSIFDVLDAVNPVINPTVLRSAYNAVYKVCSELTDGPVLGMKGSLDFSPTTPEAINDYVMTFGGQQATSRLRQLTGTRR
jgi:hypothetical protein